MYSRCEVDPDGEELQVCNLLRHAQRPQHIAAHAKVSGMPAPPQKTSLSRHLFERVLGIRRQGGSLRQIEQTLAKERVGRKKFLRLQYSLAEAMRFQAREQLAKCTSICLYQDGCGANLVMRYAGADARLNTYKGVLGIGNHVKAGNGSEGLAVCTQQVHGLSQATA